MTSVNDGGRPRRVALYFAWVAVILAALLVGSYTLGFVMDVESLGTANEQNLLGAADEFGNLGNIGNTGNVGNTGNTGFLNVEGLFDWPGVELSPFVTPPILPG